MLRIFSKFAVEFYNLRGHRLYTDLILIRNRFGSNPTQIKH
jgi:hypothetical protein